jgi:hypothetical protein
MRAGIIKIDKPVHIRTPKIPPKIKQADKIAISIILFYLSLHLVFRLFLDIFIIG